MDPALFLKVWDQNAQKDVSGQVVPAGTTLNFRIESNMYTMSLLSDFTNPPPDMRIKVKTADGTIYTSLCNTTTSSTSLVNLMVNTPSFYWVPVNNPALGWVTNALDSQGNRMYQAGTYTVWAESNTNGMKDNSRTRPVSITPEGLFHKS
jgi:hypothetical protein